MAHTVIEILHYTLLKKIKYMHIHTCIFYTVQVYNNKSYKSNSQIMSTFVSTTLTLWKARIKCPEYSAKDPGFKCLHITLHVLGL
jgi:hypothetical protein